MDHHGQKRDFKNVNTLVVKSLIKILLLHITAKGQITWCVKVICDGERWHIVKGSFQKDPHSICSIRAVPHDCSPFGEGFVYVDGSGKLNKKVTILNKKEKDSK